MDDAQARVLRLYLAVCRAQDDTRCDPGRLAAAAAAATGAYCGAYGVVHPLLKRAVVLVV